MTTKADLLAELKPLLERSGFAVETASDGEQALRLARSLRPDLIILDVLMPRMDGREVLRRLRQAEDMKGVSHELALAERHENGTRSAWPHQCSSSLVRVPSSGELATS